MFAEDNLKNVLQGAIAAKGCVVTCRDIPSLEIVLRTNTNGAENVIITKLTDKNNQYSLFVKDSKSFQEEVERWLNPFTNRKAAPKERKRRRDNADSSDETVSSDND